MPKLNAYMVAKEKARKGNKKSFSYKGVTYTQAKTKTGMVIYKRKGKKQGYNARMDESLGMRRGKAKTKTQSYKSRRDEAKGSNKASGKRAYASVKSMDKKRITKAKWKSASKDYKSIIKGQKYMLMMTNEGTALVPVTVY